MMPDAGPTWSEHVGPSDRDKYTPDSAPHGAGQARYGDPRGWAPNDRDLLSSGPDRSRHFPPGPGGSAPRYGTRHACRVWTAPDTKTTPLLAVGAVSMGLWTSTCHSAVHVGSGGVTQASITVAL